jgi:hypothetical protein
MRRALPESASRGKAEGVGRKKKRGRGDLRELENKAERQEDRKKSP